MGKSQCARREQKSYETHRSCGTIRKKIRPCDHATVYATKGLEDGAVYLLLLGQGEGEGRRMVALRKTEKQNFIILLHEKPPRR